MTKWSQDISSCASSWTSTFTEPVFLLYMSVLRPKFCKSEGFSLTFSEKDIICCAGVYKETWFSTTKCLCILFWVLVYTASPGEAWAGGAPDWMECQPEHESGRWVGDPWVWAGSQSLPGSWSVPTALGMHAPCRWKVNFIVIKIINGKIVLGENSVSYLMIAHTSPARFLRQAVDVRYSWGFRR